MFRKLDETVSVAGQISIEDVAAARAQGFTAIVNNRPEREQPGQPAGAEIAAAAEREGLSYDAVPVGHDGFAPEQIAAMRAALERAEGPLLAFCRSGTRSTWLWALARAKMGDDPAVLAEKAAAAGYDLSGLPQMLGR